MNFKTNPNDTAYPIQACDHEYSGLTIRQKFAMKAMEGHIASGACNEYTNEEVARFSVAIADALINELNK